MKQEPLWIAGVEVRPVEGTDPGNRSKWANELVEQTRCPLKQHGSLMDTAAVVGTSQVGIKCV